VITDNTVLNGFTDWWLEFAIWKCFIL